MHTQRHRYHFWLIGLKNQWCYLIKSKFVCGHILGRANVVPPPTPTTTNHHPPQLPSTTPKPTINNGIERSLFILQPYTYSKTSHFPSYLHQHQLWFLSNLHDRVSFHKMIKIRGNNPILTLKHNIFLHISSKSTPISFKPS